MAEKKLVAGLEVETGQSKQNLEAVREAAIAVGEAGIQAAPKIESLVEGIERGTEKIAANAAEGRIATERELNTLAAKYVGLKTTIENSFGSIEAAPKEIQNAFRISEAQIVAANRSVANIGEEAKKAAEKFRTLGQGASADMKSVSAASAETAARQRDVETAVDRVVAKFGDVPEQIEKIRSSNTLFSEQKSQIESIQKELQKEADALKKLGDVGEPALRRVKTSLEQVDRAVEEVARESQTSAGRIADGFKLAERQYEKVTQTVRAGSPEMAEQLRRLIGVQVQLRKEIEATHGSVDRATPEIIQQYRSLSAQIEKSKGDVRELSAEIRKQGLELGEAGGQWQGLLGSVGQMSPAMGKVAAAATQVGAAIGTVIAVATAFHRFARTDLQEVSSLWEGARDRVQNYQNALADLLTGQESFSESTHRMAAALRLSKEEFQGLQIVEGLAGQELDGYKAKADDLARIARAEADALRGGADTQRLWNKAKADSKGDVASLIAEIDRLNPIIALHNQLVAQGKDGEEAWRQLKVQHGETIGQLQERLKALGIDVGNVASSFDRAKASQDAAKAAHEAYLTTLQQNEQALKNLTQAENDAWAARSAVEQQVNALTNSHRSLSEQIAQQEQALQRTKEIYGENSVQVQEAQKYLDGLRAALAAKTAELDRAKSALVQKTEAERAATAAVEEHRKKVSEIPQHLDDEAAEILRLVESLTREATSRRVLSDEQQQQIERLRQLRQSALDLDPALEQMIDRVLQLLTEKTKLTDATGKVIEASGIEQESVRKEIEAIGKAIEQRIRQQGVTEGTAEVIEKATDATKKHSEALEQGVGISIRWSEKAKEGKLAAQEAADVMRGLKDQNRDYAAQAEKGATATEKAATALPKVKSAAEQAATPTQRMAEAVGEIAEKAETLGTKMQSVAAAIREANISETVETYTKLKVALTGIADEIERIIERAPVAKGKLDELGEGGMSGDEAAA